MQIRVTLKLFGVEYTYEFPEYLGIDEAEEQAVIECAREHIVGPSKIRVVSSYYV